MKILFVTARCPFPPRTGDSLIAAAQLEALARHHEVHLAWLTRDASDAHDAPNHDARVASATGLGVVVSRRRALRGWARGTPALVGLYASASGTAALRALYDRTRPDLVHVQTIHAAAHARRLPGPKVLDLVDSMAANMDTRARTGPLWRRPAYALEAALLTRYERDVAADFARVVLASASDAARFRNARVNENGTSMARAEGAREDALVVFHGNMDYAPNVDAAQHLVREILPHVAVRVRIVGRNPTPEVRALHGGNVVVTGAVDDVSAELGRATLAVQPVRIGSGIPNKLLEAMACGTPVVTSSRSIAGLPGVLDGVHVFVADGARQTARAIEVLLADRERRHALATAARVLVSERFTWERNVARLEATWAEAMADHRSAT